MPPTNTPPTYQPPLNPIEPSTTPGGNNQYDFITSPEQPKQSRFDGMSKIVKIGLFLGFLLILLILFMFIKGLIAGKGNAEELKSVVSSQTQVILFSSNALVEPTLSAENANASATTNTSVTSSRGQLINYMVLNGIKLKKEELNQAADAQAITKLEASLSNSSYNEVYQAVMKEKLANYKSALSVAYDQTKGPEGKKMLKKDYEQAVLIESQFSPSR